MLTPACEATYAAQSQHNTQGCHQDSRMELLNKESLGPLLLIHMSVRTTHEADNNSDVTGLNLTDLARSVALKLLHAISRQHIWGQLPAHIVGIFTGNDVGRTNCQTSVLQKLQYKGRRTPTELQWGSAATAQQQPPGRQSQ